MVETKAKKRGKKSNNFKKFLDNFSLPKGIKVDINLDDDRTLKFEIGDNKKQSNDN